VPSRGAFPAVLAREKKEAHEGKRAGKGREIGLNEWTHEKKVYDLVQNKNRTCVFWDEDLRLAYGDWEIIQGRRRTEKKSENSVQERRKKNQSPACRPGGCNRGAAGDPYYAREKERGFLRLEVTKFCDEEVSIRGGDDAEVFQESVV